MQKPEWLPQVSICENFSYHYAVGFSHKLRWISSADSLRHTLILLHFIYVRLPSVSRRKGWQEMDVGEGKSQGLLSCPSCWLLWGFSTSSCQVLFTIQLSPWSSGPPTTFAFSNGGWHFWRHQTAWLHWPLLCPWKPCPLQTASLPHSSIVWKNHLFPARSLIYKSSKTSHVTY